jgi:hypothetical protein
MLWAISAALVLQLLALKSCRLAALLIIGIFSLCVVQRGWFQTLGTGDGLVLSIAVVVVDGGCSSVLCLEYG